MFSKNGWIVPDKIQNRIQSKPSISSGRAGQACLYSKHYRPGAQVRAHVQHKRSHLWIISLLLCLPPTNQGKSN
jgi:hypothetical protein